MEGPCAASKRSSVTVVSIRVRAGYQCAGCGEWNDTAVDECAGSRQEYVEDCQVCCKPNLLRVHWDVVAGEFVILAELE